MQSLYSFVTGTSPLSGSVSLPDFKKSDQAKYGFGWLFCELLKEGNWSQGYQVAMVWEVIYGINQLVLKIIEIKNNRVFTITNADKIDKKSVETVEDVKVFLERSSAPLRIVRATAEQNA